MVMDFSSQSDAKKGLDEFETKILLGAALVLRRGHALEPVPPEWTNGCYYKLGEGVVKQSPTIWCQYWVS